MSRNTTIWKFALDLKNRDLDPASTVDMPEGSTILSVGEDGDHYSVWAEVDPTARKVARRIFLIGTGRPIPREASIYVQTFRAGDYVWHVYDGGEQVS